VFLIVDNRKAHRARAVTRWVREHRDRLELFYLPAYTPEHNPEEFLNNDLKQTLARRGTPKTKAAFKSGLTSYMRSLQQQPARVRAFFQAPSVRYAA
jgi:transposase